ncbi:hypothetical protein [Azospirillum brasilense]|uniref:hypothetical protein n=1 Tax=Azospirillum brasilense TaxID=192 RepID=UPI000E68FE42|nr:hypothetical protein [Azospirillum brasilense]NUB24316.1 hypothetical protein [Azospirillum brasilense]NUB34112.1 hypothetical protein [Azospirillum brasilense]RIW00999.1 hypothetical protein D2T81_19505 [Azospirillum brasilense]
MAGRNVFARIGVQMDADQARRELESINQGVTKLGSARLDTARTQFEQLGASVGKTASAYQPLTEAQRRAYEQREDDVQQIARLQRAYATLGGALSALDVQVQHGHRSAQDAARLQSGLIEAYSKGAVANDNLAASYQRIIANIDPAIAAQKRYETALAELRAGASAAGVSVEQLAADEAKLAAAMSPAALAAQKEAAALEALVARLNPAEEAARRAAASHALLDRALAGQIPGVKLSAEQHAVLTQRLQANAAASAAAAQGNARLSGSMTNLSYQLQDAIVQAQMGTNGFIILAQQGSQAASAFGPVGAVIGTVLSIAGAAGKVLFGLGDSANSAASSVELLGRTVAAQGDDVEALTAKYERLTEAQRNLEGINLLSDLKKSRGGLGEAVKELDDAIKDSVPRMLLDFRDIDTPLKPVREILKGIGNGSIDAAEGLIKAEVALRQTGLAAGFFDEAVLDAASKVGEMGDKTKLAEAYLAVFSGTATAAQLAMVNYTAAAKNAATAATDLAIASGQAAAGLFWQEEDLDRKIAALKGGEAAMKTYNEEQVRRAAYKKAYDDAIKADIPILYAEQKATEIATKAVEAHRLELKRAEDQKTANAADRKAESQAERDAKAYRKVSEELDRGIAEQQRLAGAVGQGVAAQREANTQTKIAEALSKAHTTASTAEGKAIAGKVREQEKWRAAAADAAVLDAPKRQLAYAQQELQLMGQAEPLRERALKSLQIQQQAGELAKTTTAENVAEWVRLQEAIADTQAIKAFQMEIQATAKEMSRDITEALLDRESKWSDLGKTIGKRIALGLIEANFVLPITTAVVGAVPGLFGIQSPANQNVANPGGVAGAVGTLGTASNALSAGQSLYNVATGTNTLGTMAGSFATSSMGTSLGLSTWTPAATSVASNGMLVGGAGQSIATPALTSSGSSFVGAAGAVGAAAPYGILGGIGGAYIGSRTNSHLAGGLSGAALGVGSMAAGTAAMGAMGMGAAASAAGVSGMAGATAALSAIPVYGWIAAAVLAAVTAIAGTQKKEYFGAATWSKFDPGAGTELGTDTASKHMDAGPVVDRKYAINSGMRTAMQASGLGFAGDGMWLGVDYDQDKQRWRTNLAGWDNGITVSSSQDPAKAIVDTLKWLANNATEDRDLRPADKLGDIPLLVGDKNVITALRNTKNTTIEEVGKDMEAARVWTDVQKTTAAGYNYFNDTVQQMMHSAQEAALKMQESYVDLLKRVSDNGLEAKDTAQAMLRQSMETSLGIEDTTTALRNLLTPTEQVRIQFTSLQPTLEALGYTAEQQAGILDKLTAKAKKSVADTYDAQLREVRGQGHLDQLWGVRQWWNTNALPVLDSGRNPNDLYEAQAKAIIDGLSDSQIDEVVAYFRDLDPVMAKLADSLRGTTAAAKARALALDDMTLREMAAKVQLGQVSQDAYDAESLRIKQARELAEATDAGVRSRLAEIHALEKQGAAMVKLTAQADNLTAWLNDQKLGNLSSLSTPEQLGEAQRQFGAALSGSDAAAVTAAASALLTVGRTMYGTTSDYAALSTWTTGSVTEYGRRRGLPGYAVGTDSAPAGWAMVGEEGPELVRFRGGERVYTAPQTRAMLGGDVTAKLEEVRRELVASRQANTRMQQVTVGALALIQQAIEASTDAQTKAALQAKLAALLADQKSEAA